MAAALKKCQSPDGSWHASLMDPAEPPLKEMSGTLFIMYGMMWGVNQGYLDEKRIPARHPEGMAGGLRRRERGGSAGLGAADRGQTGALFRK